MKIIKPAYWALVKVKWNSNQAAAFTCAHPQQVGSPRIRWSLSLSVRLSCPLKWLLKSPPSLATLSLLASPSLPHIPSQTLRGQKKNPQECPPWPRLLGTSFHSKILKHSKLFAAHFSHVFHKPYPNLVLYLLSQSHPLSHPGEMEPLYSSHALKAVSNHRPGREGSSKKCIITNGPNPFVFGEQALGDLGPRIDVRTHRHREQTCGCQGEGRWRRDRVGVWD